MSGEMDAAGGLATAGLVAGVIEGPTPGAPGEGGCLNCGAALSGGRFCSNCGQAAHANRSLWALVEELAWNVFNLDTKAWRTLPRLVFRPGTLTRTYIDGKRARYLTPLATFLLCYFFMFLVFASVPKPDTLNLSDNTSSAVERVNDARENLNDARERLQDAQQELTQARQEGGARPNAAQQIAIGVTERAVAAAAERVQRRQAALERAEQRQREPTQAPVHVSVSDQDAAASRQSSATPAPPATTATAPLSPAAPASETALPPQPPAANADLNDEGGLVTLDDVLRKIARDNVNVNGKPWLSPAARAQLSNPPLFYNHLQESASRWGFLLVPISLPFIAFLFLFKKNITLYDHTVFALNSLSFASLLFALMLGAAQVPWLRWLPGIAFAFGLPVHTFFHIGGAYQMKWWSALWRTFFMLFFALFVLIIFFIAVLFIGLAG